MQRYVITPAHSVTDYEAAERLMVDYAASLDVDLGYQNFADEVADLQHHYAPPRAALLLAHRSDGYPLGCVALRPMAEAGCCEMKRLYVAPAGRRLGLGAALVQAVIKVAQAQGYREMRLDTLPTMRSAIALYAKFGFEEIPAYYATPIPGTVFLRRALAPPAAP